MTYQKISSSGLVFNDKGQILMVKRSDLDEFMPGVYELPGGGTDFLEHPAESLQRELKEECGIEVEVGLPLTTWSFVMPHEGVEKHTVEIIFHCKVCKDQTVNLSEEHTDFKWVSLNEAEKMTDQNDQLFKLLSNLKVHPLLQTASI
jgi:8-oxo-dGTP diphosphatase